MVIASLTQPIVDFSTNVIADLGVAGVFLLSALGSACIPVPSEAVLLFAGFKVADGSFGFGEVVIAALAGNMVGSWVAYGVGYFGRIELLHQHGKWLHITPARIELAERWFARHGSAAVLLARLVPLVRAFISLPAGLARMPLWRFTWLSFLGTIPWVVGFSLLGWAVGDNWERWQEKLHYFDYLVIFAVVVAIAYLIVRRVRASRAERVEQTAPDTPS